FFAGYDYADDLCAQPDFAAQGYKGGVPMGSELSQSSDDKAPKFAVWAMRDAGTAGHPGVPLSHVQIVKGWVAGGKVQYAVHNVIDSGAKSAGVDASCKPTGKGADELCK